MKKWKIFVQIVTEIFFGTIFLIGVILIIMRIFGYGFMAIETGSMKKTYPVGSLVIVQKIDPEEIVSGDVITYVVSEEMDYVTHRVVGVNKEERYYYTKGDENNTIDFSPVDFENLLGKVVYKIPYAGYAVIWSRTLGGQIFIVLVFLIICLLIFTYKIYKWEEVSANEKTKNNEKQEASE